MKGRFFKPDFLKKILLAILIGFGIGFPGSIFAPGLTQAQERAIEAAKQEQACQGSLIWYEARGEPIEAQRGVLDVAINRAVAKSMTICAVVMEKQQFQWTKHHDPTAVDEKKLALLHSVRLQPRHLKVEKNRAYLWFFSVNPAPSWSSDMECTKIGRMHFCRKR